MMGGSDLLLVEDHLPADVKGLVSVEASPCLGLCRGQGLEAPFATVDGVAVRRASVGSLLDAIGARLGETK